MHTAAGSAKEADIYQCLIHHLKSIQNQRTEFMRLLFKIFGPERLNDGSFIYFIAKQIGCDFRNLKRAVVAWTASNFEENRHRPTLPTEVRQKIFDEWLSNSITSTDARNGRCEVRISKTAFKQKYENIIVDESSGIIIEEKRNKRGTLQYSSNRRICTSTVRTIQQKLSEKNIDVSIGSVLNLRPFFITYASEKEMSLCMCKLCLNARLMFDPLMAKAKKDGDETFESITHFFSNEVQCPKSVNGYFKWSCSTRSCRNCKNTKPAKLACMSSNELVTVEQFETIERQYLKINKKTNEVEQKTSKLTDKVETQMSYSALYKKLTSMRKSYTTHKYQIYNDMYHWPRIMSTVNEYGEIRHCDYSENMSQMFKHEPQSAHFNKRAYSLHCTVEHTKTKPGSTEASPNRYIYHLSDDMKHDYAFTSACVNHHLETNPVPQIIRQKNDNCGVQYKCRYVFGEYQIIAIQYGRVVIIYYGVAGHGKGLVDAMSSFGVKGPMRRAVYIEGFKYSSAADICNRMESEFRNDDNKLYYVIEEDNLCERRKLKKSLPIEGCVGLHMIAFHPDGRIETKVNMCSCNACLLGKFTTCQEEPGKEIYSSKGQLATQI